MIKMTDTLGFVTLPNTADDSATEIPTLRIDCFNPRTVVDFGDVKGGKTSIKCLTIENPQCEDALITTIKFPNTKTILLHGYTAEESRSRVYRVPQFSCIDINMAWTPDVKGTGGMRHTIELEWERKRFHIMLVGFIIEVKQKKKIVKRVIRRTSEKPLDLSLYKDENTDAQRFKGIVNQTSMKSHLRVAEKKPSKVLGECHANNVQQVKAKPHKPNQPGKPTQASSLVNQLQTSVQVTPLQQSEDAVPDSVAAPSTAVDTPDVEGSVPEVAPTPVQPLPQLGSSSGGSGDGSTPRKRRTWAAPDSNPLCNTPTVVTRSALKRIGEQSMTHQTFMECHSIVPADSILEQLSPSRDMVYEKFLLAPFPPPNESVILPETKQDPAPGAAAPAPIPVPNFNCSPDENPRSSGGPLTATPRHPSMAIHSEQQEDALPCFDTSIIPHLTSNTRFSADDSTPIRKSEAFVVPLIETTSSTVNLSQEEASSKDVKSEQKVPSQAVKTEPTKKQPAARSALASSNLQPKGKKPEVQFRAPLIKSSTTRPKTAPGSSALSRREFLKKSISHDVPPRKLHPAKRRSVSASRAETTKLVPGRDAAGMPRKRKDLVTPNMVPGKTPNKRPLQRVAATDISFREKRHRSCDVMKTPNKGKLTRRSVAQPTTGTRVKMQTSKTRSTVFSALPRHPLALSTASNFYFDEKWKAKQERGFTVWMNYYLCSPEGSLPPDYQTTRDVCKNATRKARKSVVAPDKAKILAKLQAERKLLQAERRACAIFQSAERVLLKLEEEINDGGLAIRDDRKLDADLGLKDQLIDLLLCYNPVWLRLGLEVLFEEVLPLAEHRDLPGLVAFLNTRFVNNPVIAQRFAHPTVPGSYGAGYESELRKFTLKRFLMLVLLLDMAKAARVVEYDPCLFCLRSPHKTSRSILISFSNTFLSGEGDITKHLGYIGYTVKHEQRHIEEVDYTVQRIETELRDGTRLTRLTEIITETSLTDKLRVPAVSRLQKLHNVGITLNKLQDEGIKLDNVPGGPIVSKSVVDGNQNLTLALIWRIIFQYSITRILAVDQLRAETRILREILSKRKHLKPSSYDNEDDFVLGLPGRRLSVDERGFFNSQVLSTLLEWCQIVCSYYDVPVDNFTVSFSDGRVLCLLVHHYHPELLPFHRIRLRTSLSHQLMELNTSRDYLSNSLLDTDLHRDNEKENFRVLADAMKGLKEVPPMIFAVDMIGTIPDEKVVITFVAYLCTALVDISQEFRAAQRIQHAWRRYKFLIRAEGMREKRREIIKLQALARAMFARRLLERLELNREAIIAARREYAAHKIQCFWKTLKITRQTRCEFLKKRDAAVKIQRFYKAILEERWKDRITAARMIQKMWRGYSGRKRYLTVRQSTIKIQSVCRMYRCKRDYQQTQRSALVISRYWRSYQLTKQIRDQYLKQKSAVIQIQKHCRGLAARVHVQKIRSAVKIQCLYRGYRSRVIAQDMRDQRELRAKQIESCMMIQSAFRGYAVRRDLAARHTAATKIQQRFLSYLECIFHRERYLTMRRNAILLQSIYRGNLVRRKLWQEQNAAIQIQAAFRGYIVRRNLETMRNAASKIQQSYLSHLECLFHRERFLAMKNSALRVQCLVRGHHVRKQLALEQDAATMIQAAVRGCITRARLAKQHCSASYIQHVYRGYQQMKIDQARYLEQRGACITIQSTWRMLAVLRSISEQKCAAISIQSSWRMYSERGRYCRLLESARKIQAAWRRHQVREKIREQRIRILRTVLLLQSHYRGLTLRAVIASQHLQATKIQATFRGYVVRKEISLQHECAASIQDCYRGYRNMKAARARYLAMRCSAITLQSHIRSYLVRRDLARASSAATKIQSLFRGYSTRRSYLTQRSAAVYIQGHVRAWLAGRYQRAQYLHLRVMTTHLQALYRGAQTRRQLQLQIAAATKIQSIWRMYCSRERYTRKRAAAVCVQAAWRMCQARRQFLDLRRRTVQIQAYYRMYRCVQTYKRSRQSAVLIQASWRGYVSRQHYLKIRSDVIRLQAAIRGYRVQQMYRCLRAVRDRVVSNTISLSQVREISRILSD